MQYPFQQGNLHISKPAADFDEKRNSKDLEKNAKAQTNIIPPSKSGTENKTTRTENQSKQPTTTTNATSVVKGTGGQQNGSVPQDVEKSTKTSQITVSFSGKPSVPQARMNGESGKNALSSGGEKQSEKGESINGKSETVQSYKTSVSVKPPSMQNNTVNKETSDKNVENSNPSKPAVVKADPKLVKSTAPAVVYHMGRPVSVDQNLGQSRDQMLEEIRNFKRKSEPISDVKKPEAKEVFSTTTGTMLESSNDKLKKESTVSSSEEEVDSGSGSAESSPKREKFVSSFSFPQKSQNSMTSVSHGDQGEKGKTTPAAPSKTGNVKGRPLASLVSCVNYS